MREETLGGLRVRITGGTDRNGGGDGPAVILMHGFGAPGTDLVSLWRVLSAPAGTRFLFPEAPMALPELGDGRAWWWIDIAAIQRAIASGVRRDLSAMVPEGLVEARAHVVAMLDDAEKALGLDPARTILGGFSQGAMLACDVFLRDPRPLAGLAMMSGTLVAADEWAPLMPMRRGAPALVAHGHADQMLPFAAAEQLRDLFVQAGLDVTWVPFRGGHEIPHAVIEGLGALFEKALPER